MQSNNFKKVKPISNNAGIGLRSPHYQFVINKKPKTSWFEVHTENFFAEGGINIYILENVARHYPLSFHGVGLSLGSKSKPNKEHLSKIDRLNKKFKPFFLSEHISWSNHNNYYLNDLLPIAYNRESLDIICKNIDIVQNYLGRQILVENPSSYIEYNFSNIKEYDFINEVIYKTSCGLLLDINNIYVTCKNHNININEYLNAIDSNIVEEIHLSGHITEKVNEDDTILLDTHSCEVIDDVWNLYDKAIKKFGSTPTLIEWDNNIPEFKILQKEAARAQKILNKHKIINLFKRNNKDADRRSSK